MADARPGSGSGVPGGERRGSARRRARPLLLASLALALAAGAAWWLLHKRGDDQASIARKIEAALAAQKFDEAGELAHQIANQADPTTANSMLQARVAMARGQIDDALALLKRIPDDDPLGLEARFKAGQLELRRHRFRAAEPYYLSAIEIDPNFVAARRELVYLYGYQLRRREVSEQLREIARRTPLSFDEVYLWCLTRKVSWEPEEACAELGKVVEADADDRLSRLALARNLAKLDRRDEFEKELAALGPGDPQAAVIRAEEAIERGDVAAAEQVLASVESSDDPDLLRLKGKVALFRGQVDVAIDRLQAALKAKPDDERDLLFDLGSALQRTGKKEEAEALLSQAKKLDMVSTLMERVSNRQYRTATYFQQLAAACREAGRLEEAKSWYQLVLNETPFDRELQRLVFELEREIAGRRAESNGEESVAPRAE